MTEGWSITNICVAIFKAVRLFVFKKILILFVSSEKIITCMYLYLHVKQSMCLGIRCSISNISGGKLEVTASSACLCCNLKLTWRLLYKTAI